MKRTLLLLILITTITISSAQNNKVLLIGIDGCRSDALAAANTPNLDALMANGTFSMDALNTGITSSGPGWSSLLTGVWPDKHGVQDNSFAGDDFLNYPHLFQRIEEHDPSLHTVSIVQWHPINDQIASGVADIVINVDDATAFVRNAAVEYLTNANSDALFLHFDDVDHAGHSYGFSPDVDQYTAAIETVDAGIGEVLDALYARPTYSEENWVVIVSTDHGGNGTSHGGNSIQERNIFIIVSGDGIPYEEIVADSVLTVIPPAFNCMGDSTELYFDGDAFAQTTVSEMFDFGVDEDFTVECRVRTGESADVAIITDKDWDSGYNPGWVFSFNFNGGPWKVNVGDGTNRVDIEGNEIADGEWHMLSATFDRDGMLTIYEDGVMVNETSMASLGNISSGAQIFMGADSDETYNYTGYIAEARIFVGLVTPTVISDWACSHMDGTHPAFPFLIAQWSMNDGVGSSLMNLGANALATALSGTQWESTSDTTMLWETDYSNTPRQVDFMVSALEHLCVPIAPDWNLDGQILATYCVDGPNELDEFQENQVIYFDPLNKRMVVESLTNISVEMYNSLGQKVMQRRLNPGVSAIDLQGLAKGIYVYRTVFEGNEVSSGKLLIE